MSEFTKQEWEDEMKADMQQTKQDEYHEIMMRTDWDYFVDHNPQVDAIQVLLEELDEETYWETTAILEYLTEPYRKE